MIRDTFGSRVYIANQSYTFYNICMCAINSLLFPQLRSAFVEIRVRAIEIFNPNGKSEIRFIAFVGYAFS